MMEKLKENVNQIEMPKEMQNRIIRNCYIKMEKKTMNKKMSTSKERRFFRKPMIAVASIALCICMTGVTALAASGKLQGFFKDITRWDGAVIGTAYEQATDEITVSVVKTTDKLELSIKMCNPDVAPYNCFDAFGLKTYKIVDANGKTIVDEASSEIEEIINGSVNIILPLENVPTGSYRLIISEMTGTAKADQPLTLSGNWECEFVR